MRSLLPLLLVTAATLHAQSQDAAPPPHHLVQIFVKDAPTMDRIMALDLDLAACTVVTLPTRMLDVIATDADIARIRAAGLPFEVAIRNLEEHHARDLAAHGIPVSPAATLSPVLGSGAMGGHYTFAQMVAIIDQFATQYPTLCAPKVSLATGWNGNNVWMVKISDNVGVDEPQETELLIDAMHHAREPLAMELTLYFMDWLLSGYGKNPEATYLIDNRQLYFVPILNPDGFEYNRSTNPGGGGLWRKNRRNNGSNFGVDINRNWTTGWNAPNGGNSTQTSSETYRGPAPMSEPEIVGLENFILSRAGRIKLGFSVHTYQDLMLHPWGWQNGSPANFADYDRISTEAVRYSGITKGPCSTTLYIAAGTAVDHYHTAHGMYAWTPELGRSNEGGFWPNAANIPVIANRHLYMIRTVALLGGADVKVTSAGLAEVTGNTNGRVEPGETGAVVLGLANDGTQPPSADVIATLRAVSAGTSITVGTVNLGRPGKFATGSNNQLRFTVATPFPGNAATFAVDVDIEGRVTTFPLEVVFTGAFQTIADDDLEQDRGFARAASGDNATGGLWERVAPVAVTNGSAQAQPGADHSPSGTLCWVTDGRGGAATGFDVDGGKTTLVSPVFDLSHTEAARLKFWAWYYESLPPGDWLQLELSNNGGSSWTPLMATNTSASGWNQHTVPLHGVLPFTDRMRVRFIARDELESVVEALIDDLTLEAVAPSSALTLWSSGVRGTRARFGCNGTVGGFGVFLLSAGTAALPVPGIGGTLLLDPASLAVLSGFGYPAAYTAIDLSIPNDPGLAGGTLHFQLLNGTSLTALEFSNRASLRIQ